ncbi:unnamed protein product [Ostreobium quekettii]|uniref:Uncharacterized protein n=1 Tax=Ostreobium quekettii TaxID=121088 RepID=A0A8S1J323_9CHLO|nr:unnamed protein product [Ostreobium quekettii]
MRVLNKKPASASASATAVAKDGAKASADAAAAASNGGVADADSTAYAVGDGAEADSSAGAYADDWGYADADSKAVALGDGAYADSDAGAYADGEVTAVADSKAVAYGDDATAYSDATAKGDAKSTAYAVAYGEDNGDDGHHYGYYPYPYYHYYPTAGDDSNDAGYDPYYYYYHGYHGYKAVDPEIKYPYYGHYVVVEEEAEEEELTPVKYVDPTILAYYAQKVYDYGCYEGKYYRCTYDESCGACPYGYFCGEKTEEVCEEVEVWAKKCDPKPVKRCVPDLSACGTGFCKYNEKCAADYYWCGAKWCTPKYSCVAVKTPKKCVWELKEGKKVQTCTDYAPEACVAGQAPCAIGYKCTEDPCQMVKSIVKKCAPKTVPVCVAYDVPIYKTLYKECGPGYCHPGYKCESFDHDSCAVKVVAAPVYHGYDDPVAYDPVYYDPVDDSPVKYDDGYVEDSLPYVPHYYGDDDKDSATVTATAVSKSTPHGAVSYSNVDAYATGDGVASGWAGAEASNGYGDSAHSGSDATASKDKSTAETTTSTTGYGVALGEATGTYEDGDDK